MSIYPTSSSHSDAMGKAILPVFTLAPRWLASVVNLPTGMFSIVNSPEMPDLGSYLVVCVKGLNAGDGAFIGQLAWRYTNGELYHRAAISTGWTEWFVITSKPVK